MIKLILKKSWIVAVLAIATFISCDKEETVSSDSVENYIDEVVFDMQRHGNCGKFGCYEFVFPLTISFADGSSTEVDDYAAMREAIKAYHEANPDGERPTLGYPLEVMSQDGEVITVADSSELQALRRECRRDFFIRHHHRGHRFRGMFCFKLSYPVSVIFPDETVKEFAGPVVMQHALRFWKFNHPDSEERPELQYPLTVILEDGTTVTVDSKEALQELKDSCSQ
ncbi:MAG: hypothetical protein HKN76_20160 [Saprospiraceae bacterium]|nr:hypothetical protein [Saprospiraceae bacterium]